MGRRGQLGIAIFVIFVLLIIAVILLIIFLKGKNSPVTPPPVNVTVNKTYWNITIVSNAVFPVHYRLSNSSAVLVKDGLLMPVVQEKYVQGIEANTSVTLAGWSDQYYFNMSSCNITRNDFVCRVGLKEKALNYSLVLTNDSVVIDTFGKTLQAPVSICFAERQNVANVLLPSSIPAVGVPSDLKHAVDLCFSVMGDVRGRLVIPVEVHCNDFPSDKNDLLTVLVRDFERKDYLNVGDVRAGILYACP